VSPIIYGDLSADGQHILMVSPDRPFHGTGIAALMTPLVKLTTPKGGLTMPLSWPAVVQLAFTYGAAWKPVGRLAAWINEEVARRTQTASLVLSMIEPKRSPDLKPRKYQIDGAKLIHAVGKVLITDEPGTGKTITTILGLLARGDFPTLVICPASVVDSWVGAVRAWAPSRRVTAYRGVGRKKLSPYDVYVTSYDTARIDAAHLAGMGFRAVVADECHAIKNPSSARSKAVRKLAAGADTVVALSGTPITHSPADLWPTLAALDIHAWPSRERWINRYCETVPGDYKDDILGLNHREPEFRTALLGGYRRVAKADVLDQLPPKVYSVRTVELPAVARKRYQAMERDMLAELDDGQELSAFSVLTQLNFLSALSCADADVEVTTTVDEDPESDTFGEETQHYHAKLKAPSWKVDALLEVLAERPGSPVVTFAQSRQLIELAGHAAEKAGYKVGYVVGGQTAARRTANVEAFQAGELDLICVTTQAGGVGITLTAAATGVFLQRPWSIVDAMQAEDRLHRIGSERHESIEIIDIVAADTIDARVRDALRDKGKQLADLAQDPRIVAELLGGHT
jgi:SNF2 family DNA or RNA helicase